ncbi:MAG: hypothetical protein DELT_01599 [Desulfovibrio sp.]
MPYYLRHYFQPDFNHVQVRPIPMADGNTDACYLGFVQNVVAGQILAELVPLDDDPRDAEEALTEETYAGGYGDFIKNISRIDPRFIYEEPVFPLGPNCERDIKNPNRIISLINGFCFYHNGLITVKKLLNVRHDVDFRTGNIVFSGNILVHGDVKPGFILTGNDIQVKGRVDGGKIRAGGNIAIHGGLKGSPTALVKAKGTVRLASCEQSRVITSGNLIIDGNCMHSELYVGGSLVVKGRLQGGAVHANGVVFIKDQLGNVQGAPTKISLGYRPIDYLHLRDLNELHRDQTQKLQNHVNRARRGPHFAAESAPFMELASQKLAVIKSMQNAAWHRFSQDERKADRTRVIVPGKVYSGVEISIGRAYYKVIDEYTDVFFALHEDEVVSGFPAIAKNFPLGAS